MSNLKPIPWVEAAKIRNTPDAYELAAPYRFNLYWTNRILAESPACLRTGYHLLSNRRYRVRSEGRI